MKCSTLLKSLALGSALLFAGAVFASPNRGSIQITDPVTVNGTTLKPGNYKVEWTGSGSDVKVTFLHGKDTVATTNGSVVTSETANETTGYGTTVQSNGAVALNQLFFSGKKFVVNIPASAHSSGN